MYSNYNPETNHQLMQSVVINILEQAKKIDAKSVSIPAISSGIFGFPKEKCSEIMLEYTIAWCKRDNCGSVKDIHLVNFD